MHLIVGIDTGKTVAYACLDLNGRLVSSSHASSAGQDWLIDSIGRLGIPSIVACDREPNDIVRKICASFNAKLYYPGKEISIDDKSEMAKPHGITNPHERDACAAATKAYKAYNNKLRQAERIAKEGKVNEIDTIKAKVIGKYSIEEAISNKEVNRR
jgi:hypothetical protein